MLLAAAEINGQKFKKTKTITRVTTKMKEQELIKCPVQGGLTTYQMLHALVLVLTCTPTVPVLYKCSIIMFVLYLHFSPIHSN